MTKMCDESANGLLNLSNFFTRSALSTKASGICLKKPLLGGSGVRDKAESTCSFVSHKDGCNCTGNVVAPTTIVH